MECSNAEVSSGECPGDARADAGNQGQGVSRGDCRSVSTVGWDMGKGARSKVSGQMSDPDKKRVVTKAKAIEECQYPMQFLLETVCGRGVEKLVELPEGMTAAEVASQLSGRVVREVTADEVRRLGMAAGKRVLIVRVSVGLLLPALQAQALPASLVKVEQVSEPLGIARVTPKVTTATPAKEIVQVAKDIHATNPIVGESKAVALKQGVSEASARFQVIDQMFQLYRLQQDFLNNESAAKQDELIRSACCQALQKAFNKVWKRVPDRFHSRSLKTRDTKNRFYGQRKSRRN